MDDLPRSYNGLLDWLTERGAGQADLVERVDGVARAFVDLASAAFQGDLARDLRPLFTQLRYLVLNIPLHLSAAEERIFIAVLRPLDRADSYSWDDAPSLQTERSGRVHVLDSRASEAELRQTLETRWHKVWSAYAYVTRELQRRRIMTWNQYLLHGCERPRPLGLIWGTSQSHDAPYYVHLPQALRAELGLPDSLLPFPNFRRHPPLFRNRTML